MPLGKADINEIDAFLAGNKRLADLSGEYPDWKVGANKRHRHASWNIREAGGIVRGSLKFRCEAGYIGHPTILIVFRGLTIWRVDMVPATLIEHNPPWAAAIGAPAVVTGPHAHCWHDNRDTVQAGSTELPCRRPMPPQVRTFQQALLWLAEQTNIEITPDQRAFELPPQSEFELEP